MSAVTVGLPVYNGADFLGEALSSLDKQTFKDIKIVISDNASTDKTPEICENWSKKDPRISYFRQKSNIGAMKNLAWVLEQAKSKWFLIASHDDKWSPKFIELLYGAATARPGILSAAPRLATFYTDGNLVTQREYLQAPEGLSTVERIRFALKNANPGWYYGLHDLQTFRSAMDGVRRFNHTWGFDYIAICHMVLSGEFTGNNEAIYYQRIKPLNDAFHKPQTVEEQYIHYRDFQRESFKALFASSLSRSDKIALFTALFHYGRHGEKPQRILKSLVRNVFSPVRGQGPMHMKGWDIEKK